MHHFERWNKNPRYWNLLIFIASCPPFFTPKGFKPQKAAGASQGDYDFANPEVQFVDPGPLPNQARVGVSVQTRAALFGGLKNLMNVVDLCWECVPDTCPVPPE
jgi:hypothetical protein